MSNLPGFSPIKNARSAGDDNCFLGMIVEIKNPYTSVRKDTPTSFYLEFTIQDHFSGGPTTAQSRLKCRLHRAAEAHLPKGQVGDIAILRHVKIHEYNGEPQVQNNAHLGSEATFFPAQYIPTPELSAPFAHGGTSKLKFEGMVDSRAPSASEQLAIIDMKAVAAPFMHMITKSNSSTLPFTASHSHSPYVRNNAGNFGTTPKKSSYNSRKEALIQDIVDRKFYNLVGEVVKMFWRDNAMDLYITDYTSNEGLFLYTDPNDPDMVGFGPSAPNWKGPYGQVTLLIRLWDNHVTHARQNLQEGDIAHLQNVRIKLSPGNKLEGAMNGDKLYPDRVCVHKCVDPRQRNPLLARKADYERSHGLPITYTTPQNAPDYERGGGSPTKNTAPKNAPSKASTKARKKEEKRERIRLQKELEQQELQEKVRKTEMNKNGLNNNVRAGHSEIQRSTVREIVNNAARKTMTEDGLVLSLPFVNFKYRTHLRVVDFWPMTISKFSRNMGDAKFNVKATPEQRNKLSRKWEWSFVLLVEDADSPARSDKERIPLIFGNAQAQNLLQMDACDLEDSEVNLKRLEEKLFILWGNLHERKVALWKEKKVRLPLPSDDPQLELINLPFECNVEEYGEPIGVHAEPDHWVQRFSSFNTTIFG